MAPRHFKSTHSQHVVQLGAGPLQAMQESQEEAAQAQDTQPEDASSSVQPSMQPDAQMTAQAEMQVAARERGTLERQLRGVAERISLAASRLQVEDAASSLTALEQLYQAGPLVYST